MGLTHLCVSVDSLDPRINAVLRGGANVERILEAIEHCRAAHPHLQVQFIVTVTSRNYTGVEQLILYGIERALETVTMREVMPPEGGTSESQQLFAQMMLAPGDFSRLRATM